MKDIKQEQYKVVLHSKEQVDRFVRYINTPKLLHPYAMKELNDVMKDAQYVIENMQTGDALTIYMDINAYTQPFINWLILSEQKYNQLSK